MAITKMSLDDKYTLDTTRAYLSGIEALVRLPILQHQRDLDAGLNTAGFISGYRGSPLGVLDQALWHAEKYLKKHNIHFQPGVNEELAATAVWGSQQVNLFPRAKYDGVFGMWYGKGPGLDRSMDAIRHANAFGTSKYGGVLAVAGDDHGCKSSTLPYQSEHMFAGVCMPVLAPANVQEVLDLGIFGWELSRYSGCWVALKAITENMDSAISADIDPSRVKIKIPDDFELPEEGLHGRWPSTPLEQERILNKYRIYAARSFARANRLDKVMIDSPNARLGILTSGKAYLDVMQALEDLGIDEALAADIGLRVYKVGMPWPLEPVATHEFARGLEEILVVEEKRSVIEDQLTGQLYNWPVAERPRVFGEFDEDGRELLTNLGELTPSMVARAIVSRISKFYDSAAIHERLGFLQAKEQRLSQPRKKLDRTPYFCSGCPHNSSTVVPQGSRAMAGIGCHYMVVWMERNTATFTQMGGEGAAWIGQAPFTETPHIFQNLGDGTYFHSGILAIRAAHAAGVNITYKILYNDAVAMTGGQSHDGPLSVAIIAEQVRAEGIQRIAVVSDDPDKYPSDFPHFDGLTVGHRDDLESVQLELREIKGTTVLIYDQICAAEKRRRRKKGLIEDPPIRVFINEAVCEGCGDCGVQSNCLSVLPQETALGRKRVIDQSACNKDYSCLKGFCPSFVTVNGGQLRKSDGKGVSETFSQLPEPVLPVLNSPWNVLVTGVGGTGVLTISAIMAMAAHIENKGCAILNQTGLAQKFGAVISHVRISQRQQDIYAVRIATGDADLLIGCDLVVAASDESLTKLNINRSHAVINDCDSATAAFLQDPDLPFPTQEMKQAISEETGVEKTSFVNASKIATALLGDSIASNLFLLGYCYQKGLVPVGAKSLEQAIRLNDVAIDFNLQAFSWGRQAAHDLEAVCRIARFDASSQAEIHPQTLDELIDWRENFLVGYQSRRYAKKYRKFLASVKKAEAAISGGAEYQLTQAVAKGLFKLMAYKDEYEVARLFSDGVFLEKLNAQFEGDFKLEFHLAVPLISGKDKQSGHLKKRTYPQFTLKLLRFLSKMKWLRGTPWDLFGYSKDRRQERQLIVDYQKMIKTLLSDVTTENYPLAIEIALLPESIRGFGHIKQQAIKQSVAKQQMLLDQFYGRQDKVVRIACRQID